MEGISSHQVASVCPAGGPVIASIDIFIVSLTPPPAIPLPCHNPAALGAEPGKKHPGDLRRQELGSLQEIH